MEEPRSKPRGQNKFKEQVGNAWPARRQGSLETKSFRAELDKESKERRREALEGCGRLGSCFETQLASHITGEMEAIKANFAGKSDALGVGEDVFNSPLQLPGILTLVGLKTNMKSKNGVKQERYFRTEKAQVTKEKTAMHWRQKLKFCPRATRLRSATDCKVSVAQTADQGLVFRTV